MIVEKLELKNFQNYEYEVIEFEEGVSLFHGSNGSGKSTILRGIFAGLFQTSMTTESAVNYTIGDLIKSGKNEGSVTITFVANKNRYTVEWELENYQGSSKTKSCTLTTPSGTYSGVRNVSSQVESIIGMDAQSFVNSVYVQQLDMMELISASASKRKKIFDGLLGFRQIDEYIERAELAQREIRSVQKDKKTVRNDIQKQQLESLPDLEKLNSQLNSVSEKTETLTEKKQQLSDREEELQSQLDEIQDARSELEEVQDKLENADDELSSVQDQKEELKQKKNKLNKAESELSQQVKELTADANEVLNECEFSLPDTVSDINTSEITERIETLNKTITTKKEKKSELETKLSQSEENEAEKIQQKKSNQEKIAEIESKIEQLKSDIESAEAKREELSENIEEVTESLSEIVEKLFQDINGVSSADIELDRDDLSDLLGSYEELTDLNISRIVDTVDASLSRAESSLSEKYDRLQDRKEEKESELEEIQSRIEEIKTESTVELDATFWNPYIGEVESVSTERTPTQIKKSISEQLNTGKALNELTDEANALYNALLDENNEKYNELVSQKEELESELESIQEQTETVETDQERLSEATDTYQLLKEQSTKLSNLVEESEKISDQIHTKSEKQSEHTSEIESLEEEVETITDDLSKIEEQQTEYETELQRVNQYISSLEENTSQLQRLRTVISDLEDADSEKESVTEELETVKDEINEVVNSESELEKRTEELTERVSEIESQLNADPETLEKKLSKIEQKYDQLESQIEDLKERKTKLNVKKENREEYEKRVETLDGEISRLADRQTELDSVISVYSNVKAEYRKQAISYINKYTNQIFQKLYTNKQYTRIEIDDEYNVLLHKQSGETIDPQFSSGGEGAIVNIAIRAGIYRVISEQSGQSKLPPFILDEPTTFLDSEHIDKLERFIEALRDWDVTQVFLVSHEELLIDSADILYEIELDGDNNSSVNVSKDT